MNVKVVGKGKKDKIYECEHVEVSTLLPGMPAVDGAPLVDRDDDDDDPGILDTPGIRMQVVPRKGKGDEIIVVRLPEDGDTIYVMNDLGRTVATYTWPPREGASA